MERTTDVVVIGGGVIGCAIAYFLRKMQVEVTVLERGEIGGQASGAAAGLLAPLGPLSGPGPFADLVLAGFSRLLALIPELEDVSGIRMGYEPTGALRVVRNPKRIAHLQKRIHNWHPLGLQLYWLSGEQARQREPLLSPDICAAVYAPEESQIQAACVVQAFARAARLLGANIYPQQEVDAVLTDATNVTGVRTAQGETIACKQLIVASGAWAAQCKTLFDVTLPVQPMHGQLLLLPQTSPQLKHIIFGEGGYVVPRGEHLLIGATKEDRGFDASVTEQGTSWLYATATRLVPVLTGSRVQNTWAGLRPKTPDGQPIIGFPAPWENVIVAAGHNSVGVILSAITGQCVAEMVKTGNVPSVMKAFSPQRFV